MADDYRNTYNGSGTLGSITPGGSATGSFEVSNDEDIFAVNLVAGRTYTFEIQGASSGFTVADPSFYLRDSVGSAVGFSSGIGGGNTNDRLIFTARTSATFYIDAFGGGGTGTYRVLADAGFVDDYRDRYDDTIEALGTLTPGGSTTGSFEITNDEDIFAVNLVAGRTYAFEIQGASSGFTVADPSFYLRDSVGSAVGFSSGIGGGNTNDRLIFTARTSATFYIDAFSGGGTGTYRVLADAGFVDDYRDRYDDTIEALGTLTPGGSTTGSFEITNDEDIFAVNLVAGRTYTFEIQGASSGFTVADPSFYLRDSVGSAVGFSSGIGGGNTNDRLVFTAQTSGTFHVDAFSGGATGTYKVLADAGYVDDYRDVYNASIEALGSLTIGGSTDGIFEIGSDEDIFQVSLVAGQTYTFEIQGASSGFTIADPSFYLRNSAGSAVGFSSSIGGGSTNDRLVYTAAASGTFYIDAFANGGTGTYRIVAPGNFADDFRDTYNDTNEALGTVSAGGSATGTIESANDQDIFSVNLTAGRTYTIDMQGASSGYTLADPSFYLRNSAGSAIGFSLDADGASTNNRLIFTVMASGTYYLDAFGDGGTGTYKVLVDNGFVDDFRDSYNDTVEALGALSAGGSAKGNRELASDQDIFRISLTAGLTYVFDIKGASSGFTLGDPSFSLRNSAGGAVGFSTGIGGGSTNDRLTYTATASGFHYVDAGGIGTGTYRLTASAGVPAGDDYRNTYNGAGTLGTVSIDGSSLGRLETGGDKDVFAVALTAGQTYTFDLAGSANGGAALSNAYLSLLNSAGTVLFTNDDFNSNNSRIVYSATSSGTFYLEVKGSTSALTGSYAVSAKTGFDDFRDSWNGAGVLGSVAINKAVYGTIETGADTDIFAVALTAGQNYTFDLTGSANGGAVLANPFLRLLNSSGTALLINDDFNGVESRIVYTATSSGTYYLETGSATSSGTGGYLVAAKADFDDLRNSYNGTGVLRSLKINKSSFGAVEEGGDKDIFKVTLTAGKSYSFELAGSTNGGTALSNAYLRLLNGAGSVLFTNDDFNGNNSRIVFTAASSGTYYLEAKGATAALAGNYYVVARADFDDMRDTWNGAGTLGSIGINEVIYGAIEESGDKDIFKVTLTAGQSYTFDLTASNNGGAALSNPYLSLLNSTGTVLLSNDDFNSNNSRIVYTAASSGTFYLEVKGATSAVTGTYQLSAKTGFDDLADTITDPASPLGIIAVGQLRSGTIETAGDSDVFRFNLVAGHEYSLSADGGAGAGLLTDGELQLFDGAGTLLGYNDDGIATLDPQMHFVAEATGTYYLDVSGVKNATGMYTVGIFDVT